MTNLYRRARWLAAGAIMLQTTTCGLTPAAQAQFGEIAVGLAANVFSNTVFFFLDNALVRLST